MKIGLLGFDFCSSNKGCEALTYSFIHVLQNVVVNENMEIINYYYNTDLGEVPEHFPNIKFQAMNIKLKDIHMELLKSFKTCDVIFDVTLGDNFSDIYSSSFVFKTTLTKEIAILSGTPLILAPQTYGPFANKFLKSFAAHVIKKCRKVYSRDYASTQFIKDISCVDATTVTDLAFLLPYKKNESCSDKKQVGINVSGLLWKGGFDKENQFGLTVDYQKYIKNILERILQQEIDVHIIPHVIDDDYEHNDDDWKTCCEIKKMYPDVILAPKFKTAMDAKNYICNMDVFIGGRMHSTIAAFSAGVATIPFSYSRKFEGLYGSLNYEYLIHGRDDTTEDAICSTLKWIDEFDRIKAIVEETNKKIRIISEEFILDLKKEISNF